MVQDGSTGMRKFWLLLGCLVAPPVCAALGIALAAILGCVPAYAQQTPVAEVRPSFEVASIKPSKPDDNKHDWDSNTDRLTIESYTLRDLVASAYGLKSTSQVLGGPDWMDKEHFDIAAKVDDAEIAKLKTMTGKERGKEWNAMMQSLLADRFGLKVGRGERTIPIYALVVAKSGAKLTAAAPNQTGHSLSVHNTHMMAISVSMSELADYLTEIHEIDNRVVVNRTGLSGSFDFKLDWALDPGNGTPEDSQYPGLFTALREQLGLELKADKGPVDVVIVEAAREPAVD